MSNVHNPPTWRWQRVVALVDDKLWPSRSDDELTVRAWRFLKRKRACTVSRLMKLRSDYPDIYEANKMFEDENAFRWLLEAALCAHGVSLNEISRDFKMPVEEIEAYEKLFWDVRVGLDSPPFIEAYIVTPALRNRTAQENSPDFMAKMTALTLGYHAMLDSRKPGNDSVEQQKFEIIAHANKIRQLSLEAVNSTPITSFNAMELIRATMEQEEKKEDRTAIRDASVDAVKELLETVSFKRRPMDAPTVLDENGREPRLAGPE